ncbi:YezD family protein [Methylomonas lenta]|uniref:YezD family protein n=1 Tax=Methylomonas lenta TaxID=980561 RepID=UPI0008370A69|nr:YezD family protein [Methylomonas lenta]
MSNTEAVDFSQLTQSPDIAQLIESLLQDIRFGSIVLVVHDGRVVQIDKHEKFRLNH